MFLMFLMFLKAFQTAVSIDFKGLQFSYDYVYLPIRLRLPTNKTTFTYQ